jgi:hypothetical protein
MKMKTLALMGLLVSGALAHAVIVDFTVNFNNDLSMDPYGDPDNLVAMADMDTYFPGYSNFKVVGIGWDVDLYADSPSWLSELVIASEDSTQTNGVFLTPGIGDDFSGSGTYSSGGVLDLVSLALDFNLNPDNVLRLELFEGFDDYPNDWDGIWTSGSVTYRMEAVPEPASIVAVAAGLALVARRRRSK